MHNETLRTQLSITYEIFIENMKLHINKLVKAAGRPQGSKYYNYIQLAKKRGLTQSQTAKHLCISISTVKRNWDGAVID